MKATVKTPEGLRVIPDWARCYCVSDHRPAYIHPYPFALPSGDELWLCPNTYHQATSLLNMYTSLDGPPALSAARSFNYFVRSLITMYWQQVLQAREDEQAFEVWKQTLKPETEDELYDDIRRLAADE